MGSTSSIGQSITSDLDIWVCHNPELSLERLALVRAKVSADFLSGRTTRRGDELLLDPGK
ncbi:hypothetical protein [uncultured Tolumonas sp.]|uniref:hypothetical protein n=1 Tax=uncultured Tolumonas sp. TaxID=263765 RepID=UPI002A0A4996|nr:hypothetical protein [uncultured Tolumonas sp.]